jgi:FixJ family two-component response regulator
LEFDLEAKQADQLRIDLERRIKTLSPREREVFFLLARGFSNQELVTSLAISLATVKQYKSEVMRKVRVQSLSKLIDLVKS